MLRAVVPKQLQKKWKPARYVFMWVGREAELQRDLSAAAKGLLKKLLRTPAVMETLSPLISFVAAVNTLLPAFCFLLHQK